MMLDGQALIEPLVELIRRSSTTIPRDVREAIARAAEREAPDSGAQVTLRLLLDNMRLAESTSRPICQDTGALLFFVQHSRDYSQRAIKGAIQAALPLATQRCYLRPNAVDPITGRNSGDNTGDGVPYVEFEEVGQVGNLSNAPKGAQVGSGQVDNLSCLEITLLQKGGGCENVSGQYSLPHASLGAQRDLEGVRRCILDGVHRAQGKGCAPGIIGVGIGGDRSTSYLVAKHQLLRRLDDRSPTPALAELEARLVGELNGLGIGPMGCGGRTTVLGVKTGIAYRVPACYFVSMAYMCWALRHHTMTVAPKGEVTYHD
jgi:fumarate hydratase class I